MQELNRAELHRQQLRHPTAGACPTILARVKQPAQFAESQPQSTAGRHWAAGRKQPRDLGRWPVRQWRRRHRRRLGDVGLVQRRRGTKPRARGAGLVGAAGCGARRSGGPRLHVDEIVSIHTAQLRSSLGLGLGLARLPGQQHAHGIRLKLLSVPMGSRRASMQ